jgi:hypothetical protein
VTTIAPARGRQAHDPFPLYPPAAWFDRPDWLEPLQKLTVVTSGPEAGRVAGYVAPWDQCLLDGTGDCWTIPSSPTGYSQAQQGDTETAEGNLVRTANLGGGVNHARLAAGFREAVRHYHNTAAQVARVQYHEDDHGIYLAGAMWPDVTEQQVAIVRAAAVSGDWRYLPHVGGYDLCGVQLVNTPGFPLIRKVSRVAAAGDPHPVYVGGSGGVGLMAEDDEPCCEACGIRDARIAACRDAVDELAEVGCLEAVEDALALIALA